MGHTYIISNSVSGWVEKTAAIWFPELLPLLRQATIISAHDSYQHLFQEASLLRFQAFLEVRRQLTSLSVQNVVILGDAEFGMDAAHAMEGEFATALIKTVTFKLQPTVGEHMGELKTVAEALERIVRKPRSLKIVLEKKGTVAQR